MNFFLIVLLLMNHPLYCMNKKTIDPKKLMLSTEYELLYNQEPQPDSTSTVNITFRSHSKKNCEPIQPRRTAECLDSECKKMIRVNGNEQTFAHQILRHVYSKRHRRTLFLQAEKYLSDHVVIQEDGKCVISCDYGCKKLLMETNFSRLLNLYLAHRYATKTHNNEEFETILTNIRNNTPFEI